MANSMKLEGKVAIVLGAAGRDNMGQTIARRFADEGAKVVVAGRKLDELEDLKNISDERIRIAIADGIRSVWCLDPDSWNGTELEVSRGE